MSWIASPIAILDRLFALSDHWRSCKGMCPLPEIPVLVLRATLSGMEDFVETRLGGAGAARFPQVGLPYQCGLSAHDTLDDVVNAVDPGLFADCFTSWVETMRDRDRTSPPFRWRSNGSTGAALLSPLTRWARGRRSPKPSWSAAATISFRSEPTGRSPLPKSNVSAPIQKRP
jgi:hypothetical protein